MLDPLGERGLTATFFAVGTRLDAPAGPMWPLADVDDHAWTVMVIHDVDTGAIAHLPRFLAGAGVEAYARDHGYCVSLYVTDPNGLRLGFTVDHADVETINTTPPGHRPRGSGPLPGRGPHQQQHLPLSVTPPA